MLIAIPLIGSSSVPSIFQPRSVKAQQQRPLGQGEQQSSSHAASRPTWLCCPSTGTNPSNTFSLQCLSASKLIYDYQPLSTITLKMMRGITDAIKDLYSGKLK
jgi:hypothetical protein